jgi:hypothetical protein
MKGRLIMKSIFKFLSGRPKNGDVIECIRPIVFFPCIIFGIILMYKGFTSQINIEKLLFAFLACMFIWQAGWSMSIERFRKSEINKEYKHIFITIFIVVDYLTIMSIIKIKNTKGGLLWKMKI